MLRYSLFFLLWLPQVQAQAPFTQDASLSRLGELGLSFYLLISLLAVAFMLLLLLGFALLEVGLNQAGSVGNSLMKSLIGLSVALFVYALLAPWLGGAWQQHWFTTDWASYLADGSDTLSLNLSLAYLPEIMNALGIAMVLAIVSAASSGRLKLVSFSVLALGIAAGVYPLARYWLEQPWLWGEDALGKGIFFTSSMDSHGHLIAGFAALGVVVALGARRGRYGAGKKLLAGHNMPLATLGGWFIAGSLGMVLLLQLAKTLLLEAMTPTQLAAEQSFSLVAITTTIRYIILHSSLTLLAAWGTMLLLYRRLDMSLSINALIASMVVMQLFRLDFSLWHSVIIGIGTGILTILLIRLFDIMGVDDPVGVISVHGVLSALALIIIPPLFPFLSANASGQLAEWQTLASNFSIQAVGVGLMAGSAFLASFVLSMIVKGIFGLRTTPEREEAGLDKHAYGHSLASLEGGQQ